MKIVGSVLVLAAIVSTVAASAVHNIDATLQQVILTEFNTKRNLIAGGVNGLRKACRMGTMQWDQTLANLALNNVKKCDFKKDTQKTNTYPISGQNQYDTKENGPFDHARYIRQGIESWYSENININVNDIRNYPVPANKLIDQFTTLALENNDRVGCAASQCTKNGAKQYLLTCNFASGLAKGKTTYSDCNNTGANCASGMNSKFPNLCSTKEKYQYQ